MGKKLREVPLSEITLRKYERPYDLTKRELSRRICLSLGLLQPGDSRDVIVDVFQIIHDNQEGISSEQVIKGVISNREKHGEKLIGVAPSNIRRQIKRLRDLFLIEKMGSSYRITENAKLLEIFEDKIQNYFIRSIVDRVKEYLHFLDEGRHVEDSVDYTVKKKPRKGVDELL